MKWWRYSKDVEKELIIVLATGMLFVTLYSIFSYLTKFSFILDPTFFIGIIIMRGICLFFSVYFLIFAVLITKKWIDMTYANKRKT